ncbi:ribose-phosphate diphosphokinase [Spiroplasma floricola]|uniref:Ribose-phosphate pyrophosphokinase n=1 Tax=Spiroplasma floricola 23-6 TaxID=1336749 RepID=A0A2K8SFY6_9MOLU|nr:ribose-phosphate pyrophosphokinase [Spiroplasma floricola]AUB32168.1 ribose-phosphate pyrophosphokinase [Spiroplasma floricola 23-6]
MNKKEIMIFGLSSNQSLTKKICDILGVQQSEAKTSKFLDGEMIVQSLDSVRGQEIYIIQSTNQPVNDNLMELLIAVDAFKRASAARINIVIPYFGYARQDRKARGRQPITSRLVANLIETAGVHRVITVDLHSAQIMGFFNIPIDNFSTAQIVASEIIDTIISEKLDPENCILVSPDHGGLTRVHGVAKYTGNITNGIAVIAKRRPEPNKAEVEFILGDVKDKTCFIIDDMIDTGGTIIKGAEALKEQGAKEIYIIACHGLFNGEAVSKMEKVINDGTVKQVVVTDTIEISEERKFKNLKIISVSNLLARMIKNSYEESSLTGVYNAEQNEIVKRVEKYLKEFKK